MVDSESGNPCGAFHPPPARTGIWIIALVWMGTACILNSRRCGRNHCRYTGPYYLTMIAPVLVLASSAISVDFYAWLSLAALILGGSMIIWWATERAWGKFSRHDDSFDHQVGDGKQCRYFGILPRNRLT